MILIKLFWEFFKIGAFTFGGGYAMIPLIEKEIVNKYHWLTMEQFTDLIAIAEMTPGPIAINSATFVGYKVARFLGAVAGTLGVVLPSFLIIWAIASVFFGFQDNRIVQAAFKGLRPAVLGLIIHSRPENRTLQGADEQLSRFSISLQETAGFSPRSFIRVSIIKDAFSLKLEVNGTFVVEDVKSQKVLYTGQNMKAIVNAPKEGGVFLGKIILKSEDFLLKPDSADAISVDGRKFRGYIRIIKNNNSNFDLVNCLDLEDYLKGIAVREVSHYWPMEALKAEVVAFRTYALYQMQQNKNKDSAPLLLFDQ